jgi:hypothetical protein
MTDWTGAVRRVEEAVPAALVRRSGAVLRVDVGCRTCYLLPDTVLDAKVGELAALIETRTRGGGR